MLDFELESRLLTPIEQQPMLASLNLDSVCHWQIEDGCLHCELTFQDFDQAFGFMTRCAQEARRLNHHPDWRNVYNRVWISLITHDAGGLTQQDFRLAEMINQLVEDVAG